MSNRPQMARYKAIERALRRPSTPDGRVTATTLSKELDVSVRTIMRDLEALRDDHGAPLEYDPATKTWKLGKQWTFRAVKLTEGELLQLAVSARLARDYKGTPLAKSLDRLFKKLQQVLDEPVDLDPDFASEHVSFFHQPARAIDQGVWEELMRALRRGKRIRMWYRKFGYEEAVPMDVDPLHLSCREGDWYLIAQRLDQDKPWIFAMSRIGKVEVQMFSVGLQSFDADAFFKNSTGRWVPLHEKPIRAKLKFTAEVAEFISEREWHPEQDLVQHRDGSCTLTRPFGSMWDAKRWVLAWGPEAQVQSPKKLRLAVAEEARGIVGRYR